METEEITGVGEDAESTGVGGPTEQNGTSVSAENTGVEPDQNEELTLSEQFQQVAEAGSNPSGPKISSPSN